MARNNPFPRTTQALARLQRLHDLVDGNHVLLDALELAMRRFAADMQATEADLAAIEDERLAGAEVAS